MKFMRKCTANKITTFSYTKIVLVTKLRITLW